MKKKILCFFLGPIGFPIVLVFLFLFIMAFIRPSGQYILDYDNLNKRKTVTDSYGYISEVEVGKIYFKITKSPVFGEGELRFKAYYGTSHVKIPEEIWIRKGIYPRKFKVTEVDFSRTLKESSFVVPKTVKKICNSYECYEFLCNGVPYTYSNNSGIMVAEDNPYFDSRENCNCIIETKTNKLLLASGENATIPSTVTEIGSFAFWERDNKIVIPGNVKKINSYAFMKCDFNSIHIEEGVRYIEEMAFCATIMQDETLLYLYLPSTLKELHLNSLLGYDYTRLEDTDYYYNGKDLKYLIPNYDISDSNCIIFSNGNSVRGGSLSLFFEYIINEKYDTNMNYYSETAPVSDGHFFHFVDGVITKWV